MGNCGSTNTVDQLLGHTKGPAEPVTDRDLARARSSAYIVHGNFHELAQMCDNISTTGTVIVEQGADETDVENEVYRRVHNYVSSLYSYNEQIRSILNKRLNQHIRKGQFLPARDDKAAPDYARRGTFLWGLRNDFQHGDYWCLKVKYEGTQDGSDCYQLYFQKQDFEATPKGDLDSAGDYLAHAPDEDQRYPLPYIGDFHRNLFSEFENAFEEWCSKNRA
ncbi:hypothetical protein E2L06_18690 [Haloterrigena sp. H1]|uniref:Uncharacterized protein n=1 Tax=Natrinema hispanicum TaxID=392421 RepID=A0A1G6X087_9EURY|nr:MULTISPECIES: hypothetical protein [Natrialbaceae]TMT77991.1 hypothetical protein E2L06_20755 [Haloterrigena sp. H1]TMT80280.1 hypothetical protein E2L06_18690 [Haloterrigena sp. H1]SDD71582.1 hypothetical protein SAMN05192552_104214 [Natrinema hispanicum]SEU07362.1 hypothetical protein SAMN04488694_13716 [Natrinema hispanicum]